MNLNQQHKRGIVVIATALSADGLLGWLFSAVQHIPVIDGIYYAMTTASTVGYGDIVPTTPASKAVTVIMEFTVIPLFAAAYSLMTAGLTTNKVAEKVNRHIDKKHEELKDYWPVDGQ